MIWVRRLVWWGSVVAGLALVSIALVVLAGRGSQARAGHPVPVVNRGNLPVGTGSAGRSATRPRPARVVGAAIPAGSRLRVGARNVDAPITPVVVVGHTMQIPRDPHTVGWWTGGAAPGDTRGSTVLVGHINFAGVTGALAELPDLRPGDVVTVREEKREWRYRVAAVRTYPKSVGIPAGVFSRGGPARLALITCGGPFDSATGNYEDNIVVYAEPV